jgi:hypothetical protein
MQMAMAQQDITDWLERHIPHRVRAGLANSDLLKGYLGSVPQFAISSREHGIAWRCLTDSVWEGRLTSIRWLIEFVGIKGSSTLPVRVQEARKDPRFPEDRRIDDLPHGVLFPVDHPDAMRLAAFWTGCSKGSSHATQNSRHPVVDNAQRDEVMKIIMDHLDRTLYKDEALKTAARALRLACED